MWTTTLSSLLLVLLSIGHIQAFPDTGIVLLKYFQFSDSTEFHVFNTESRHVSSLVTFIEKHFVLFAIGKSMNIFVAYDRDKELLCYIAFREPEWYNPVCSKVSNSVRGLAIDDASGNVYWSDDATNAIYMANVYRLDTIHVVVDTHLEQPGGVIVYPEMGFLFWTNSGLRPKIERSTLDGKSRLEIYLSRGGQPKALTLDKENKRLFWLDGSQRVLSCDIYGGRAAIVVEDMHRHWGDLFWYQDLLYGIVGTVENRTGLTVINVTAGTTVNNVPVPNIQTGNGIVQPRDYSLTTAFDQCCYESGCFHEPCVTAGVNCSQPFCEFGVQVSCFCRQRPVPRNGLIYNQCVRPGDIYGSIVFTTSNEAHVIPNQDVIRSRYEAPISLYINSGILTKLATDVISKKIFLFQFTDMYIMEMDLRDMDVRPVVRTQCNIKRIVLDWVSHNLYWITECSSNISVITYSGEYRRIVVSMANALDLGIDPYERQLFWINGANRVLEKSDLSGNDKSIIQCSGSDCERFSMMTVDLQLKKIFYYDIRGHSVAYVDYNGIHWRHLFSAQSGILLMSVVQDFIVYVESNNPTDIKVINKFTGTLTGNYTLCDSNSTINDLALYHLNNPHNSTGACSINNGGCSQICTPLRSQSSKRCLCGAGYSMDHITGRCNVDPSNTSFLLVADQGGPALYQYNLLTGSINMIPVIGLGQPYAVGYDDSRSQVYWSDFEYRTVNRVDLNGNNQEIIFSRNNLFVFHMYVSGSLGLVYFADYQGDRIIVMSIATLQYRTLFSEPYLAPQGFAIHIPNRDIYLTRYRYTYGDIPKMFRINMDGSNQTEFNVSLFRATHVLVTSNSIFVVTSERQTIKKFNLSGDELGYIVHGTPGATIHGITTGENKIYWTNRTSGQVYSVGVNQLNPRPGDISVINFRGILNNPAGILYFHEPEIRKPCPIMCNGICIIQNQQRATCLQNTANDRIQNYRGFCTVPAIEYGFITNNRVGNVVPNGFRLNVGCVDAHSLTSSTPLICRAGRWNHIPGCTTDYEIHGNQYNGCTVFRESGKFYVYETMELLNVTIAGAGGGGYDVFNTGITRAGNGQYSKFGSFRIAYGGKGGNRTCGGAGGLGNYYRGYAGDGCGSSYGECNIGGSVWDSSVIQNLLMECNNHDSPEICNNTATSAEHPCNVTLQSVGCKRFGDGSVSRRGGAGGSGGIATFIIIAESHKNKAIRVTVGKGGTPSYGPAGDGVVIIKWRQIN